jgi:hypothetical protein
MPPVTVSGLPRRQGDEMNRGALQVLTAGPNLPQPGACMLTCRRLGKPVFGGPGRCDRPRAWRQTGIPSVSCEPLGRWMLRPSCGGVDERRAGTVDVLGSVRVEALQAMGVQ